MEETTNTAKGTSAISIDFSPAASDAPDPKQEKLLGEVRAFVLRMRLIARSLSLLTIGVLFYFQGWYYAVGALWGSLLVEGNLSILARTLFHSRPDRLEKPLWVTVGKFYFLFALTAFLALIIIIKRLGHHFGFLAGLFVFIPAFLATGAWFGIEKLVKGRKIKATAREGSVAP
ncbi:MAG: hypothetical protein LBO66_11880 [Deltaproteobacteria bacterium]|jgi:hypothetical protein|nr:hypothetical protein [Deltaproteobacteria bacterium]